MNSQRHLAHAALIGLSLSLGACVTDPNQHIYDYPEGAVIVSQEEYARLIELGSLRPITESEYEKIAVYSDDVSASSNAMSSSETEAKAFRPVMPESAHQKMIELAAQQVQQAENSRRVLKMLRASIPSWIREKNENETIDLEQLSATQAKLKARQFSSLARSNSSAIRTTALQKATLNQANNTSASSKASQDCAGDEENATSLHPDTVNAWMYSTAANPEGLRGAFEFPLRQSLTCVKDQGNRGTCTAFAAVAVVEAEIAATTGRFVNLSEQDLYSHEKNVWSQEDLDDGYYIESIFRHFSGNGGKYALPKESFWPYNPSPQRLSQFPALSKGPYLGSCEGYPAQINQCAKLFPAAEIDEEGCRQQILGAAPYCSELSHQARLICTAEDSQTEGGKRLCGLAGPTRKGEAFMVDLPAQVWDVNDKDESIEQMATLSEAGRPMIITTQVPPSFDAAASGGFVSYQSGLNEISRGGHAVALVGYISNERIRESLGKDHEASGTGYFIIKNSWGPNWGDGGYAYVPTDWAKEHFGSVLVLDEGVRSQQF